MNRLTTYGREISLDELISTPVTDYDADRIAVIDKDGGAVLGIARSGWVMPNGQAWLQYETRHGYRHNARLGVAVTAHRVLYP